MIDMTGWSKERKALRRKYLAARSKYDRIRDEFGCGITLAKYISPRLVDAENELEAVEREVRDAMRRENFKVTP